MPSHISNRWNSAVGLLTRMYGELPIGTGSCFFWKFGDQTFLLTNWHNLAGRNPLTNQPISKTGAIPDQVTFMAYKRISNPDAQGYYELKYLPVEVKLYDDSDLTTPNWFEHPVLRKNVDVAAIDVTKVIPGYEINHVNELENDALLEANASQEVFVIGFPFGQIANAPAPIWKRGSIALDPTFNPEGLPKMLVDTATREGMSGSVVVATHIVVGRDYPKKNGTNSEPV